MTVIAKASFIRGPILAAALVSTTAWAGTTSFSDTYNGNSAAGAVGVTACDQSFAIDGQEPAAAGKFPVFVYMVGTTELSNNASATAAVAGMANRGYVAASVAYNTATFGDCSQIGGKAQCIFDPNSAVSAITKLCTRAKADCSKGVVVGGFSQGAVMATLAKNFDKRVRAAWGMGDGDNYIVASGVNSDLSACMDNGNHELKSNRLRIVNGEHDDFMERNPNTVRTEVQKVTGLNCGPNAFNCLQGNGSGWYIVQSNQVQDGNADHCYMRAADCLGSADALDAGWQNGGDVWELNANLDWLTTFTDR
ncbi:MAG: hypothetical protein ACJ8E5_19500 [Xanthobacteraceae bacterium]